MLSVTLIESDAYRYAAVLLIFVFVWDNDARSLNKDPIVVASYIVGAVALSRFMIDEVVFKQKGASEWLYAFPLFFPLLGWALHKSWGIIPKVLFAFFSLALFLLLITTPWGLLLAGDRFSPLFHHNSIHGAVGCGFIFCGAFFWAIHYLETERPQKTKLLVGCIAGIVMFLSMINIFGSESKGVWLALIPVLAAQGLFIFLSLPSVSVKKIATVSLLLCLLSVAAASGKLAAVAGATSASLFGIGEGIGSGKGVMFMMQTAIENPVTPLSLNERLQLWSNAIEVWSLSPLIGNGATWLEKWQHTRYAAVQYTLMHNGYFEILIRHGIAGLLVYGVLAYLFARRMFYAMKIGIVTRAVFACYVTILVYFLFTIFTNSNNRLALGESYVLLFAATSIATSHRMRIAVADSNQAD